MRCVQLRISRKNLYHNYSYFKELLAPSTKIMVMVKANGYGIGAVEVATLVQEFGASYLGVARPSEGVALKEAGISLPIMVFTPVIKSFDKIIEYGLEPSIINPPSLEEFGKRLVAKQIDSYPIHLKFDTGMRRVGFKLEQFNEIEEILKRYPQLKVKTLFSHLAAADNPQHDTFSKSQIDQLLKIADRVNRALDYRPMTHILNSPGVERFDSSTTDMVRLGIGLYGISYIDQTLLKNPISLAAPIIHLQTVKDGTVGYERAGKIVEGRETTVATVAAGYGDGLFRHYGGGNIECLLNGKLVPTLGNISMDLFSIDVTGVECKLGDEVVIIGEHSSSAELAKTIGSIPYEVLANLSRRVGRVIEE